MKKVTAVFSALSLLMVCGHSLNAGWLQEPGRLWEETISGKKNHISEGVQELGRAISRCGADAVITATVASACGTALGASPTGASIAAAAATCGLSVQKAGALMQCNGRQKNTEPTPVYKSVALAWTSKGGWTWAKKGSLTEARTAALSTCIKSHDDPCTLSSVSVGTTAFRCLALANSGTSLYAVTRKSENDARQGALANCRKKKTECKLSFVKCND